MQLTSKQYMQKGKSTLNFISNWKEKHCEERRNNSNKNIKAYWKLFLRQAKLTLRLAILFFATIEKFRSDNGMLYGLVSIDAESTGKYIFHIFSCIFLRDKLWIFNLWYRKSGQSSLQYSFLILRKFNLSCKSLCNRKSNK